MMKGLDPSPLAQETTAAFWRLVRLHLWLYGAILVGVIAAPLLLAIALPVVAMLVILLLRALLDVLTVRGLRREAEVGEATFLLHLVADIVALGVLLFLSGGVTNPAISLLLVPVIVAAPTLPPRAVGFIALLATATYVLLMFFSLPLAVGDTERAMRLHLIGMGITFAVSALLISWFVVRMTAAIRARDAALAAAREEVLRGERLAALGALATGAAHRLGTPLATLAVTLGDLAHEATLPAEARADIDLMRAQVERCKAILSSLTSEAGVARLEGARLAAAGPWLETACARWQRLHANAVPVRLTFAPGAQDARLIVDQAIEQALENLLDNAVEADASSIDVGIRIEAGRLVLVVADDGDGLPTAVLAGGAKAPQTDGARGLGLGLFLARTAIERLGGGLALANRPEGGAEVRLIWPASGQGTMPCNTIS